MSRKSGPCGLCGHLTWAKDSICTRCVIYARHAGYSARDGLHGGQWVLVRGVLHWRTGVP